MEIPLFCFTGDRSNPNLPDSNTRNPDFLDFWLLRIWIYQITQNNQRKFQKHCWRNMFFLKKVDFLKFFIFDVFGDVELKVCIVGVE